MRLSHCNIVLDYIKDSENNCCYKYVQKRTNQNSKILVSLFVTQVLTLLSICTLYAYQIRDFAMENCNLYRIHFFVIAFFMTWSSVTLTFIDQYLLILRGSKHIKLKQHFPTLTLSMFIFVAYQSSVSILYFRPCELKDRT